MRLCQYVNSFARKLREFCDFTIVPSSLRKNYEFDEREMAPLPEALRA